MLQEDPLPS